MIACGTEKLNPTGNECIPGTTLQCYCTNDSYGVQICNADGYGYAECDCTNTQPPRQTPPGLPDPGPQACNPPLEISPERSHVLPWELTSLHVVGGSGLYQFEFDSNQSGGLINSLTGSYLAGNTPSSTDIIKVTDSTCTGEATTSIQVVSPMDIRPRKTVLNPTTSVQIAGAEGSGDFSYYLSENNSGASISSTGLYTAGSQLGIDTVVITDTQTHEQSIATFDVVSEVSLLPEATHLVIPVGQSHQLEAIGGSGHVSITGSLEGMTWNGQTLTLSQVGSTDATIIDEFTGVSTSFQLEAVESLQNLDVHSGEQVNFVSAAPAGDINQDGFIDGIVAIAEANLSGHQSGGVFLYEGTSLGLNTTPIRVISGETRNNRLGSSMHLADINADGLQDLIVGAYRANVNATYGGAIYIYYGIPNGFFEPTPTITLAQNTTYAEYGLGITSCDFNGDDHLDIAVAARQFEDRDATTVESNQGAVFIYLGNGSGISVQPSQIIYGQSLNDDNQWVYTRNMKLGKSIASGHLNDDAYCDLVLGAQAPLISTGDDGAVFIYAGHPGDSLTLGGVRATPALAFRRLDGQEKSQLGRSIAVANIDNAGLDEIIIGEPYYDSALSNAGAVYIIPSDFDFSSTPTSWTGIESFSPHYVGDSSNDYEGWFVSTNDHNNDGIEDVMVASLNGETPDSPSNAGTLRIFYGLQDQLPSTTPSLSFAGEVGGDRFGFVAASLDDVDNDGFDDYLSFNQLHDALGYNVGLPFFVSSNTDAARIPLDYPTSNSGQQFGRSVAFVKSPSNDGTWLNAVGANFENEASGYNRGAIYLYPIDSNGQTNTTASQIISQYPRRANWDQFGYDVVGLDDFNDDGRADLAVISFQHHRKNIRSDSDYIGPNNDWTAAPTSCDDTERNDTGALFIFLGQSDGTFYPSPEFVFFGHEEGQKISRVTSGDINGDGLSDIVISSEFWDSSGSNAGGVALILGRTSTNNPDRKTEVICEADFLFRGKSENDKLGYSLDSIGDINTDGCDDFAAGSRDSDQFQNNGGEVRVIWGWGGTNCPTEPTVTSLASAINSAKSGSALAGGDDLDGDGILDLIIGGEDFEGSDGTDTGIIWFISGSYLLSLDSQSADDASSAPLFHSFGPAITTPRLRIEGVDLEERFGAALAIVPNLEADNRGAVLVGHPGSWEMGYVNAGGASVYRFRVSQDASENGFNPIPHLKLTGETNNWGSELGSALGAMDHSSGPLICVGGYWGLGNGVDSGSAYTVKLTPPN